MKIKSKKLDNSKNIGSVKSFLILLITAVVSVSACSSSSVVEETTVTPAIQPKALSEANPPSPDPRVGLKGGLFDAQEAVWNLKMLAQMPSPEDFVGVSNSDLAFKDNYVFQGNYNGVIIWDISNAQSPELVTDYLCPASQSDVSVYGNLLFVSGEGFSGRLDCGTVGVNEAVSEERLRGIRIFDITNVEEPVYVSNVQTCRGSHTHSVLKDPDDDENVYIYVSGSAPVRPEEELPGCSSALPDDDPNSALFRIEIIKVPLANPEEAAIVNSPRIFENLDAAPTHGLSPADIAKLEAAKEQGAITAYFWGSERIIPDRYVNQMLTGIMEARGGTEITAADSAYLHQNVESIVDDYFAGNDEEDEHGPNQCHDITLYPEIGLAGGACEGYGLLLDITDPVNPVRVDAVADSNFSYWHSATFNNDGSNILFTDEWGGGSQPKCRVTDPMEWGANALFTINDQNEMEFKSYYKISAPQTEEENCVAHNGSLIPVPGRDIMVQSWYQGGISVFDWTDPANPVEIAYHDRGPVDSTRMQMGGSWSVYWYNGLIVNSEIARGLDIFELEANPLLTQNEIYAANTVKLDYLNAQGQPKYKWPTTFVLAKAYVDQLDRNNTLSAAEIANLRTQITAAENASGSAKTEILVALAEGLENEAANTNDSEKVSALAKTLRVLTAG